MTIFAARRALAADPTRQIGATPVVLQDWSVPIVYEVVPLTMLNPQERTAPRIQITGSVRSGDSTPGVPRPPDAGFFGRDETLLALDRAFDTRPVVLLHGYAGAGKSATAAEFTRWYQATGGLDHPEVGVWRTWWEQSRSVIPRGLSSALPSFSASRSWPGRT